MLLNECGVSYADTHQDLLVKFEYHWKHFGGEEGISVVWCHTEADLLKLLNFWNRAPEWKYWT